MPESMKRKPSSPKIGLCVRAVVSHAKAVVMVSTSSVGASATCFEGCLSLTATKKGSFALPRRDDGKGNRLRMGFVARGQESNTEMVLWSRW